MSDDMRLYFFECGSLKTQVQFIKMNQGLGDPYEIPVPFFLIVHPNGNVLYDGGNALEVARDARGHWADVVDAYDPVMGEEDFVVNQLERMDVDPASVRYVIQSQLHWITREPLGTSPTPSTSSGAGSWSTPSPLTGSRSPPTSARTSTGT